MSAGTEDIDCNYFKGQEAVLSRLTEAINESKSTAEKKALVGEYLEEVGVLLNCPDFDDAKLDCRRCRSAANIRKESVEVIEKALTLFRAEGG
jgi:hypothetical protein